jgi:MFS family permease
MAWLSAAILAVVGFALMVQMAASNTLVQMIVDDDKRGRVMSIYTMAFIGMAPLGSLIAGFVASRIGATNALVINGCILFAASVYFSAKVPLIKKSIQAF